MVATLIVIYISTKKYDSSFFNCGSTITRENSTFSFSPKSCLKCFTTTKGNIHGRKFLYTTYLEIVKYCISTYELLASVTPVAPSGRLFRETLLLYMFYYFKC